MKKFISLLLVPAVFLFNFCIVENARAGELRLVEEYKYEIDSGYFQKMDPNRFILTGYVLHKGETAGPRRGIQYKMFDMKKREFTNISFPVQKFQEKFPELLGTTAAPQLKAYNGETSCFNMNLLEGYRTVVWYYCQYNHETGKISEKIKMADVNDNIAISNMGIDPSNRYFYYSVNYYQGDGPGKATTGMHLYRVSLKKGEIDWDMKVMFKKRPRQLDVHYWVFNNDGTKLALLEYDDKAGMRESKAEPQAVAYVIDIPSQKTDTYPIPLSPYGRIFSPDSKYLFIGSNEEGKIARINLEEKKVDLVKPAIKRIFDLILTPASKALMIFSDTTLVSPKVAEVRATKDLSLVTSIPAKLLMPGDEGISPGPVLSFDGGKYIAYTVPGGKKGEAAFRIYEVPEDLNSPKIAGNTDEELRTSQGVVLANQYADSHGIELAGNKGIAAPEYEFATIVMTVKNRIYLTGTSGIDEGNYIPENTRPIVACLDAGGKLLWKKELPKKGFREYSGASIAVDKQGNCVAFIISWYHPGNYGVSRFVKLSPAGEVLWDTQLRGKGNYNTPLADDRKLLQNGSIKIKGRIDLKQNVKHYWSGEINKDGKIISDVTGERYE